MSIRSPRIDYLIKKDAIRAIQRWWKNVAYMNDAYKCPVCMSSQLVSRAVSEYTCDHILCRTCVDAWTRQCSRANRQSTCPVCRASSPVSRTQARLDDLTMDSVMEDAIVNNMIRTNLNTIHNVHNSPHDVIRGLLSENMGRNRIVHPSARYNSIFCDLDTIRQRHLSSRNMLAGSAVYRSSHSVRQASLNSVLSG